MVAHVARQNSRTCQHISFGRRKTGSMIGSAVLARPRATKLRRLKTRRRPFAIGQVQDAGLIFLGKMAKEIADALDGEELEDVVATTLAGLCGATALLGLTEDSILC